MAARKSAKNRPGPDVAHGQERLLAALMDLLGDVAAKVSPQRIDEIGAKLAPPVTLSIASPGFSAAVMALVADLSLFTAPLGRSTALERYAKATTLSAGSIEVTALTAMVGHRFRLFEIVEVRADGVHQVRDRLSGEALTVITFGMARIAGPGERLAGRLVATANLHILLSGCAVLDEEGLAVVRPWLARDGRSIANPARCAEAVYRWAVARARIVLPGVFGHDDADEPSADPGEVFEEDVLHQMAAAWTASSEAPSAQDEQRVRRRTTLDDLITVIQCVRAARETGETALAIAYERMAVLQLETLYRRASVGNAAAAETLRAFEMEIDRAVAAREIPTLYRDLHRELSRRAGPATGATAAPASPDNAAADLDKLRGRIQALRAKTVERGCTEEEALAAAAKVADLLDRHGLSLSELEMRQQACEGFAIETGRRRRVPIDDSVGGVADFCDCRYWIETNSVGELRFIFFGLPADVSGARCLYDMIVAAVAGETAAFKAGALYAEHPPSQRASAVRSFQIGMVHGIVGTLHDLKERRTRSNLSSSGRDLVPIKADIVEDEMAKLGMRFTSKAAPSRRGVLKDAFHAGRVAGETFEVNRGLDEAGH